MNDKFLHQYCLDWVRWCETRCFYMGGRREGSDAPPGTTGMPPDARNSADLQYFNMAVHMLADMADFKDGYACFNLFYVKQVDHVKREADRLGICRKTYYNRIKAFAKKAFSMAASIRVAHEARNSPMADALEMCVTKPTHLGA
jgi:hypothetical protein